METIVIKFRGTDWEVTKEGLQCLAIGLVFGSLYMWFFCKTVPSFLRLFM